MKPRFEAVEDLAGWLVWDELSKLYIMDFGSDEEGCRARVEVLNEREKTKPRSVTVINDIPLNTWQQRVQCPFCPFLASTHGSMVIHFGNMHPQQEIKNVPPEKAWKAK